MPLIRDFTGDLAIGRIPRTERARFRSV